MKTKYTYEELQNAHNWDEGYQYTKVEIPLTDDFTLSCDFTEKALEHWEILKQANLADEVISEMRAYYEDRLKLRKNWDIVELERFSLVMEVNMSAGVRVYLGVDRPGDINTCAIF